MAADRDAIVRNHDGWIANAILFAPRGVTPASVHAMMEELAKKRDRRACKGSRARDAAEWLRWQKCWM
jgi:hypothetical protein